MNAARQWENRVLASRAQKIQPQGKIWSTMAQWYDSWVRHNDYVSKTLPILLPFIHSKSRILEVGPGTGAFTIPLAKHCSSLLAVEPAEGMQKALHRNLDQQHISNVHIIPLRIEHALGTLSQQEPFDLTLASFALYDVENIVPVLKTLRERSARVAILLGTGEQPEWSCSLYRFSSNQHVFSPQLDCLQPLLIELGFIYNVNLIPCSCNYVFPNEHSMLEWWTKKLRTPRNLLPQLKAALKTLSTKQNGVIGIYSQRTAALVTIEGEYASLPSLFIEKNRVSRENLFIGR